MNLSLLLGMLPFEFERVLFAKGNRLLGRRPSSGPFLSGDSFRALADFVFDETGDFEPELAKAGSIVFLGTSRMEEFLKRILPALKAPIVLLSHQEDLNVDKDFASLAEDPKIGHWFAKNALLEHPKITPLPIGLEDRWRHNNGALGDFRRFSGNRPRRPRVALAFTLGTNVERRVPCYLGLSRSGVTTELPQPLNSSMYRRLVRDYMFVASPPGNGADCHRTWETMYLGGVPIVEDNAMHRYFKGLGLPMLIVKDWSEASHWTENSLGEVYKRLAAEMKREALFLPFWAGLIGAQSRRIAEGKGLPESLGSVDGRR